MVKRMNFKVCVDTREVNYWRFSPEIEIVRQKLDAGDYAILGDSGYSIERKSAPDMVQTLCTQFARFEREIDRWTGVKTMIVEADFVDFCYVANDKKIIMPEFLNQHPKLTVQYLVKRLAQVSLRGVHILFCHDAELSSAMALSLFKERWRQLNDIKRNN